MGNIAVIGASGAIGRAFCNAYADRPDVGRIYAFSRSGAAPDNPRITRGTLDLRNEASIAKAALAASADGPLSHVIVASGLLHDSALLPEKSFKSLSAEKFMRLFEVNAIGPALIAKHFIPKMDRAAPALFAALSARVGSISDNFLGGWHAYRASKAALNMIIKCVAIEYGRSAPNAIVIGLHPGTVKSALSAPFERGVAPEKLFLPEEAVAALIETMNGLTPRHSGKCFAYNGEEIAP